MKKAIIILFTRYPVEGQTKTRLIPALGAAAAAELHGNMTAFALREALATGHEVQVHYTGASKEAMQAWLGDGPIFVPQVQGDLGQRMYAAFLHVFTENGLDCKVLLMGSDCPENRCDNLVHALTLLDVQTCVLGPSVDGGYYLMGLRGGVHKAFFEQISWGSSTVLAQTKAKVGHYALLPSLQDVDYAEDIPQKITVILPTYQEEQRVAKAIASAMTGFAIEVLVCDGGSTDATCRIAQDMGAKVFLCPEDCRGRARQMNYGAERATGDIVLFLHADSLLPAQWDREVRKLLLENTGPVLGYFRFAVSGTFWGKALLTWGTNVRAQRMPYGDQALFLRKKDFFALGAYADVPILEDVCLVKAMKEKGKICGLPLPVLTSGRRWQERGFWRVVLLNQIVLAAAALGIDLEKIRQMYRTGSIRALWK